MRCVAGFVVSGAEEEAAAGGAATAYRDADIIAANITMEVACHGGVAGVIEQLLGSCSSQLQLARACYKWLLLNLRPPQDALVQVTPRPTAYQ